MARFDARSLKAATLTPPVSKSDAQRALALAYALDESRLASFDLGGALPADVRALQAGLDVLRAGGGTIDCGDGGAPFRILAGLAATTPGTFTFTGSGRLGERPHDALLEALQRALPITVERGDDLFPLTMRVADRRADTPRFTVRAAESSQFATSLLLASVRLSRREQRAWQVELEGTLASERYLALTYAWLERAGVVFVRDGARTVITPEVTSPRVGTLPGDWSSIGYLLCVAWKTGGSVRRVDATAEHPDRAMLDVLTQAGLHVQLGDETRVRGAATCGVEASGAISPDLLPTVAALACVLPGPSTLHAVDVLRHKESDRVAGIEALVSAGGARWSLHGDSLTIHPGRVPPSLELSSRGDHRIAMSAATLAVLGGSTLTLDDPSVVDKSFPSFWEELALAGVTRDG